MLKIAQFQLALFGINTYVVYDPDSKECAIIDPGMSSRKEEEAVSAFIEREGLSVRHLINTHLHIDHAIGDSYVVKKYGVGISAHKGDAKLGRGLGMQAAAFGLPMEPEGVEATVELRDGDTVSIGSNELQVLHIPGHSPGSIVLYDKADGFVIAGDVLFAGSIGRTDLPGGSHADLLAGIKEKLLPLPDDTKVYPGHGPATTIGAERHANPFLIATW